MSAGNVSADATPFSFPPNHQPESAPEEPVPGVCKERREKKQIPSDTSSSSDSDESSEGSKYRASNVITIKQAKNVHIGNSYQSTNTWQYNNQNCSSSENDSATIFNESRPSEELLNSTRELEVEDMYIVAENIPGHWKKLARFLPPKPVFSDGQLKTFEENNPRDIEEAIIQMLQTWKQRHPNEANIRELATTLCHIGKGNISQKLKP